MTTFVAGFIGVSNLMPAEVVSANGAGRVRLESGPELAAQVDGLAAGERCQRSCAGEAPDRRRGRARARRDAEHRGVVESSLYLGTATQIVVRVAGEVPMTVLVPNADDAARQDLPGGGAGFACRGRPSTCILSVSHPKPASTPSNLRRRNQHEDQPDQADGGARHPRRDAGSRRVWR